MGNIAHNEQFPTLFSTQADNCIPFCPIFAIISLFAAELEGPKISIWGKGLKWILCKVHVMVLTHYQTTNLRLFQTERVCRQQFQIWWKWQIVIQTCRKNPMGKWEIARYEQFLLFPQCFQNARFPGVSKGVIVWEWVKNSKKAIQFDSDNFSFIPSVCTCHLFSIKGSRVAQW